MRKFGPDVAIVSGDFVKTGGMDRANYALADYLRRAEREVDLVAHRVAPELSGAPGVTFRRVRKPLGSYILGEPFLDAAGRRASARMRARGGLCVVNGGNCLAGPVNWVHYVHAAYFPALPRNPRAALRYWHGRNARARERSALRLARLVIANSRATREILLNELGVPPEHAFVVYYGIDAAEFTEGNSERARATRQELSWPDRPTVAFVGALGDRRKGFDTVFEAWRILCRTSSWDVNLVAAGGGTEVSHWQTRAQEAGLGERIRMLGFRSDVHRILAACDAFVAPTRYEAFGLAVAEALAMRLPAITSAAAGVAELYPKALDHLLLADPESPQELARKLELWRANLSAYALALGELTERVRSRSWDDMAQEITALMDRVR
jgi:glycosyltransferase involved in cell wall biosynthesis